MAISSEFKTFDLCLNYYGDIPNRYVNDCDIYLEGKGAKWPKLKEIVELLGDRIHQYDAVWFPDDDISTNAYTIHCMLQIFYELQFMLAQE